METLGIYVSVPFCRAKCSFCNFASGVWDDGRLQGYVDRVCDEIAGARGFAARLGVAMPEAVDTLYFGGGTPSLLNAAMWTQVFARLRGEFALVPDAEITVECAPGQVADASLEAMLGCGVNRLSFGVQSFVDAEGAAVGRLHTGSACREELARMQRAGVDRLGLDLICGLPGQTFASWKYSVDEAIASGVEHLSVYMLEVDEGSRLGREALRGGPRYGAADLPAEDDVADWYVAGCAWLAGAGVRQYEISNFARAGGEARHNRKYWERKPYVGFGLDAHSMLRDGAGGVRWAGTAAMEEYAGGLGARGFVRQIERVDARAGLEEALFTGLRLVQGVSLRALQEEFGGMVEEVSFTEMVEAGLLVIEGEWVRLTEAGRMVSNEVFGRLLLEPVAA